MLLTPDFIKAIGVEYVCIIFLRARDDQRILIEPKRIHIKGNFHLLSPFLSHF